MKQPQFVFHQDPKWAKDSSLAVAPSLEDCVHRLNPANPDCLFNQYVGQESAKKKLSRVLISALQRYNHQASDVSWLLTGPSSVGKTTLAKLFAKILGLPFIEINPTSVNKLDEIFELVKETLERYKLPLIDLTGSHVYKLPPCIIFIDEAHALKKNIQNGLLKAIESADRVLITENKSTISTAKVTWMMATTDVGDLCHALINRFTEIALKPYNRNEIAKIVNMKFKKLDIVPCAIAAYFEPKIPRKAIEFAQEMIYEKKMSPSSDWIKIGLTIAKENDIDEMGMPNKHLKILLALSKRSVSKDRLANILNIRPRELTEFIIPWMIAESSDCPALISVSTAGFKLTQAGYNELKKRNLISSVPRYLEEDIMDETEEATESSLSTKDVPDIALEFDRSPAKSLPQKQISQNIMEFSQKIDTNLEVIKPSETEDPTVLKKVEKAVKNFIQQEILNVGVGVGVKLAMEAAKRVF